MTPTCETQTSKTPAGKAGASREQLGGWSHSPYSLAARQAQFLTLAHAVRPEWAAMLAAFAFGGKGA